MSTTIANSAVANTIFDTAGNPITASTQPNNEKASFAGPTSSSATHSSVETSQKDFEQKHLIATFPHDIGTQLAVPNSTSAQTTYTTFTYTLIPAVIDVGDYLLSSKGFMVKVTDISGDRTVLTVGVGADERAKVFNATLGAERPRYFDQDQLKSIRETYPGVLLTDQINGSTNKAATGGSDGPYRGTNNVEAIRTTKTATAIRANYWDEFAGEWTTEPTVSDDTSTFGTDSQLKANRVSYNMGGVPAATALS